MTEWSRALQTARLLKAQLGTDYWQDRLAGLKSYSKADALAWLSAYVAQIECAARYNDIKVYEEAEQLASLCMRHLENTADERLRLDIGQRLANVLYKFRGTFPLAFALLQETAAQAQMQHYYLRKVGCWYNYANALVLAGQFEEAFTELARINNITSRLSQVPQMGYYIQKCAIALSHVYAEMGYYEQSLRISTSVKLIVPNPTDEIDILLNKATALHKLGYLDEAAEQLKLAIQLSEKSSDNERLISSYADLIFLYSQFSNLDLALEYCERAQELGKSLLPEYNYLKCRLLFLLAEVRFKENDHQGLAKITSNLETQVYKISIPYIKSRWFKFLGEFYISQQRYQEGEFFLNKALILNKRYSSKRALHAVNLVLIDSYIKQNKYDEALKLALNIWDECEQSGYIIQLIELQAAIANIEYQNNHLDKAITYFNNFVENIEKYAQRISNSDYLLLFNQKIYKYLKQAAIIETEAGNLRSALTRLDFCKTLFIGCFERQWGDTTTNKGLNRINFDEIQNRLQRDEIILNYSFQDSALGLYAITRDTIVFEMKSIDLEFEQILIKYLNTIVETNAILNENDLIAGKSHHQKIVEQSEYISKVVFDWKILSELIPIKTVYILPDDILFELPFNSLTNSKKVNGYYIEDKNLSMIQSLNHFKEHHKHVMNVSNSQKVLLSLDDSFPNSLRLKTFLTSKFEQVELLRTTTNRPQKDIIKQLNGNYDILIIVGHSYANFAFPNDSYIQCTAIDKNRTGHEVQLSLQNIKTISWPEHSLIFLIGCQTGRGKLYQGTGLASLQRYISYSGGHFIISSQWEVDAAFTINQTISILELMLQGNSIVESIRLSQIVMISSLSDDPYYQIPHPYLWSSLSLLQY